MAQEHKIDGDVGEQPPDEMKAFLLVLRRALLMLVHYINRKYNLQ